VEIVHFVDEDQIDSIYCEAPYYLEPEKGSARAYAVLCESLRESKKVAVCQFVMQAREHLGILKAAGDLLVLERLRYHEEIKDPGELKLPATKKLPKREVDMARALIDQLTESFDPALYRRIPRRSPKNGAA